MSIQVSKTWKNAIQAQFRYPGYLRIQLDIVPPDIVENTTVSSTDTDKWTQASNVLGSNNVPYEPTASLEHNRWLLGGNMALIDDQHPVNNRMGWWSDDVVSTSNPIVFLFSFSQAYDLIGFYIQWDTQTNSWATDFTFEGLDANNQVIQTRTVKSAKKPDEYYDVEMTGVHAIRLTFRAWSKPNWRARIEYIVLGRLIQFDNDRVQSATYGASTHLLSNQLPTSQLDLEISNYDREFDPRIQEGVSVYLARRQQVRAQWGFETSYGTVEWLKEWPLWLSSWSIPADAQTFKLSTGSRLAFMTNKYIYGQYTGTPATFATVAQYMLEHSTITKEGTNEIPWDLDPVLSTLYTRAPLPIAAENTVLQLLANAAGCMLTIDNQNDHVCIKSGVSPSGYIITENQQLGDPSFQISDRLKSVQVSLYTFSTKSSSEKIYSFDGKLSGHNVLQIVYDSDVIAINPSVSNISGATLNSATFYARAAVLDVTAPDAETDVDITITGTIVEESKTWIQTYANTDVVDGLEVSVDNPLITEMATLRRVADATLQYYQKRTETVIPYLGYPELQPLDTVDIQSTYGKFSGDITDAKLSFNGGFDGTITVRNRGELSE